MIAMHADIAHKKLCSTIHAINHGRAHSWSRIDWAVQLTQSWAALVAEIPCACNAYSWQICVQEKGFDTVDANRELGLPDDCREYSSVKNILNDLDIKSIRLIVCPFPHCKGCVHAPQSRPLVSSGHVDARNH